MGCGGSCGSCGSATKKYAAFNIDVDPLPCYYSIHGIEYKKNGLDPIYEKALPRFGELLKKEGIKATFFITANGLDVEYFPVIQSLIADGHEIANHSYSHNYRLTELREDEIQSDLRKNIEFIEKNFNITVSGFRAPGYNTNSKLMSALKKTGHNYDSSSFPSPFYYAAKWAVIKMNALKGRPSRSIISSFRDAFGPHEPYFCGEKITEIISKVDMKKVGKEPCVDHNLLEFPITAVTSLGLPLIGTSIIAFPHFLVAWMAAKAAERKFVNIETHAIDLADSRDSALFDPLNGIQPDLKYDLNHKMKRLKDTIKFYKDSKFNFVTLSELSKKIRGLE